MLKEVAMNHGIKATINGIVVYVKFHHYNERVTKCEVSTDLDGVPVMTGYAKVNLDEGDVYDEKKGEVIAIEKALHKLYAWIDRDIATMEKEMLDFQRDSAYILDGRLSKRWKMLERCV